MKVYHVCAQYHENCCDEPLFATLEAALAFVGCTVSDLSLWTPRDGQSRTWSTNVRDQREEWSTENWTITEIEVRE